jgi:hypothetical protein
MALRLLKLKCDDCEGFFFVRKPLQPNLVAKVAQMARCPRCHPETLDSVCPACVIPFSVVPCHAQGLCYACYISGMRWKRTRLCDKNAYAARSEESAVLPVASA